jgi:hypothetical protein
VAARSDHSGGVASLPVRTMVTRWRGNIDRGGEVAASDRPDQNARVHKGVEHRASGDAHGARCPAASDRRAGWRERSLTSGPAPI